MQTRRDLLKNAIGSTAAVALTPVSATIEYVKSVPVFSVQEFLRSVDYVELLDGTFAGMPYRDIWICCVRVTVTKDVQFVGHENFHIGYFTIAEYANIEQRVQAIKREEVKKIAAKTSWTPIATHCNSRLIRL
jgi:hypothetical protein